MGKRLPASSSPAAISIRRATPEDAPALVAILQGIAAERMLSAISEPWTVDEERTYLESLTPREVVLAAVIDSGEIVGFQPLELWSRTLTSTAHVAQLGTFLLPRWRRRGVGRILFQSSLTFAREAAYAKMMIQVRAANETAQRFYRQLGFRACGRLKRQVRIDDVEDDEILMEFFL
jgi:ribosomal protein S18 acetylase RimI-like enzyme